MQRLLSAATREEALAIVPALAQPFADLYAKFWQLPMLPAATLELCRLRLAQLHSCATEWSRSHVALAQRQRDELHCWASSAAFSAAECACLSFAEVYAMDVQAIDDALADGVKQHYGDAGLVALIEALGIFDAMTRLSLLWRLPATGERA